METYKEIATQIVDTIKKMFNESKKNGYHNPIINIVCYSFKSNKEFYYYFVVGKNNEFGKFQNIYACSQCLKELVKQLSELQTKKGYKTIVFDTHECGNYPYYYTMVDSVSLLDEPCKEFTQLKNYIEKYSGFKFKDFDIYSVSMSGKRGQLFEENGKRYYLAHDPKKCSEYLQKLRQAKNSNDTLLCVYSKDSLIYDESDRKYSEYYETEFIGTKCNALKVTIQTKGGKVKSFIKIEC